MRRPLLAALMSVAIVALGAAPAAASGASTTGLLVYNVDVDGDLTPGWVGIRVSISPVPVESSQVIITDDLDPTLLVIATYPAFASRTDFEITADVTPGHHELRAAFSGTGALLPSTSDPFSFQLLRTTTSTASIAELGGQDYRVDVSVNPPPATGTAFTVTEGVGNVRASGTLGAAGTGSAELSFTDGGPHTIQARVTKDSADGLAGGTSNAVVARGTLTAIRLDPGAGTATLGYPLTVYACVATPLYSWGLDDIVHLREAGANTVLATGYDPGVPGPCDFTGYEFTVAFAVTSLPVGTHTLVADYVGNDRVMPAGSNEVTDSITADTKVDLRSYSPSPTTFYPIKDGYRDTTALRWSAGETLSETTDIYNSAGALVVRLGVKSATSGAVAWNGRNAAGTILAAGTYKFRTTFRDKWGHTLVKTASVTLSHKRLHTVSATYYRNGENYSYSQRSGAGLVLRSESHWSTGVWLDSGQDAYGGNQARVFYKVKLPSAIGYKSLAWSVLGKNYAGRATSAIWQYSSGWYDPQRQVYSGYAWTPLTAPASTRVTGGYATGAVIANGYYNSLFDVRQVKLTVTYSVLR